MNPHPYRSPLWQHLQEIKDWRAARDDWQEIADKLFNLYQIRLTKQGVSQFFKRSDKVKDPLGFKLDKQKPNSVMQRIIKHK
jgi:hypothetical protein